MISAPIPENEKERIEELKSLQILDSPTEQDYDDVVKLASAICQTPMSLVTLIDAQRSWTKAAIGIGTEESDRRNSFCAHAILDDELMIVPNALEDERFFDNPNVTANPNIRFYAGMPLVTKAGYRIGALCVVDSQPRDLTEQQKFALKTLGKQVINMLELRLKNQRLSRLNSLQNKFLAIISHDVRNPLVAVEQLISMMDEETLTIDDFKSLSHQLKGNVSLTIELLNNLIDWGISQTRGDKVEMLQIPLREKVDEEIKRVEVSAQAKGIEIENLVEDYKVVVADSNMLRFIIRNLITNAIKFTAKGKVSISLGEKSFGWVLNVSDTGVGIPEDKQKKLFDWERRYTTNGTNNEAGSGLGLLMCKEFAEKHLGTITLESKPGVGTTFSVAFNTKFLLQ